MKTLVKRLVLVAVAAPCFWTAGQQLPAITPVDQTGYDAVAKYLNPGGSFYFYMTTAQWAAKLDEVAGTFEGVVVGNVPGEEAAKAKAVFTIVRRFIAECGLADLHGVGLSSVRTGDEMYHNRIVMQHPPGGRGEGLYWDMFTGENGALDLLEALPPNTALASSAPCRLAPLWTWICNAVMESGSDPLIDGFEQAIRKLDRQGIAIDLWFDSLGESAAFVLTVDPDQMVILPAGGPGKTMQVPGFALALLVDVGDTTIFDALDALLANNPGVQRTDGDALRTRIIPAPLPPPVRPTIAQYHNFLILSTSDKLVEELAHGDGGLAETELFKKLAGSMPKEGMGFSFVTPAFGDAIMSVMQASMKASGQHPAAVVADINKKLFGAMMGQAAYTVSLKTPDGIVALSNTNYDFGQALVMQAALVPVALVGGAIMPAMTQARSQARRAADMNNLKQIGVGLHNWADTHDRNFPDDLGLLMENNLLTQGGVYVSPAGNTQPPANGEQIRTGQCDYIYFGKDRNQVNCGSGDPIACSKPGLLGGQRMNVLYGDGHVQFHGNPPQAVGKLLQEAGIPVGPGRERGPRPPQPVPVKVEEAKPAQ